MATKQQALLYRFLGNIWFLIIILFVVHSFICRVFSACNINCHKKCEKKMPNLCGVNQKLLAEALETIRGTRPGPGGKKSEVTWFWKRCIEYRSMG